MYNRPSYRRSTKQRNSFESANPISCALPCLLCKKKKEFIVPWTRRTYWGNRNKRRAGVDALPLQAQAASLLPVRGRRRGLVGLQCRRLLCSAAVGIPWSSEESGNQAVSCIIGGRWDCELGNADRWRGPVLPGLGTKSSNAGSA